MYADPSGAAYGLDLGGRGFVSATDVKRQTATVRDILTRLESQPGVVLADEVGMGKTYVALGVAASVMQATWKSGRPVIVTVPRGLVGKWERDWEDFIRFCVPSSSRLRSVTPHVARRPMELFRLFEKKGKQQPRLVITSASAYTGALTDPWIKLLLVRIALMRITVPTEQRKNLEYWLPLLLPRVGAKRLSKDEVGRLLRAQRNAWPNRLAEMGVEADDASLVESFWSRGEQLDWRPFADFLNTGLLSRYGQGSNERHKQMQRAFNDALSKMFTQWRALAAWKSPLLILDEAHHAKNDSTRLAKLFRGKHDESEADFAQRPLVGKFDRMLLLTATPFQLGHHELIQIIRCLGAVRWTDKHLVMPSRSEFEHRISKLGQRLTENHRESLALQRIWGRIDPALIASRLNIPLEQARTDDAVLEWLRSYVEQPETTQLSHPIEAEIARALAACRKTKQLAEHDPAEPWASLRTWVIRHNRPTQIITTRPSQPSVPRRIPIHGSAISHDSGHDTQTTATVSGLTFGSDDALAFLLAARAQGEAAAQRHRTLVQFSGGLCSSYEAFHHTRTALADDVHDDAEIPSVHDNGTSPVLSQGVPLSWYTTMIARHVPGIRRTGIDARTAQHPKLGPVVKQIVDLWERGEKSVVFCFYRQTSLALQAHIDRAVKTRIDEMAMRRTGHQDVNAARATLKSISQRLGDGKSPFHLAMRRQLTDLVHDCTQQQQLPSYHQDNLIELLLAYVRSLPFLVRSLPENAPELYSVLGSDNVSTVQREQAVAALLAAVQGNGPEDRRAATSRFRDFLNFVLDASGGLAGNEESESKVAAARTNGHRPSDDRWQRLGEDLLSVAGAKLSADERTFSRVRAGDVVRMVNGSTAQDDRQRVMRAFNSPLFPDILVSSSVLGEGVDLHRFCRHVIHHDLDWNPSRIEQRTGRVDRIRCLAERDEASILVYTPYIAGSADERMFRVVQDRQRWFQVVMGQKYDLTEAQAEELVERLPLPVEVGEELTFRLDVGRRQNGER